MRNTFLIILSIIYFASAADAFVLSSADTLGREKVAISGIYSVNRITSVVSDVITADLTLNAYGFIFNYGVLEDLDLLLGIGNIRYGVTPDIGSTLKLEGGTLTGIGLKYAILKENGEIPVSLAVLLQHTAFPANLVEFGEKDSGWNNDTYMKLIFSKQIHAFIPFLAVGVDSRILRIGGDRSENSIFQIDLGYGTAVSENLFLGVELNWSEPWHDRVMDEVFADKTRSEAIGVSFGIEYIY